MTCYHTPSQPFTLLPEILCIEDYSSSNSSSATLSWNLVEHEDHTNNVSSESSDHRRTRGVVLPPPPILPLPVYEWVHQDVIGVFSDYQTTTPITELRSQIKLSTPAHEQQFICYPCSNFDCVCMRASEEEFPFVFLYNTKFKELRLTLSFSSFQCFVLSTLNVVPSQLHPNSWAFIRAFEVLCTKLHISPTTEKLFLWHPLPRM